MDRIEPEKHQTFSRRCFHACRALTILRLSNSLVYIFKTTTTSTATTTTKNSTNATSNSTTSTTTTTVTTPTINFFF